MILFFRTSIILAFFFIHTLSFSQKTFSTIELGKVNAIKFVVVPANDGTICLFYHNLTNLYFTVIDSNGNVLRTRSFKRITMNDKPEPFLGATVTDKSFILFLTNTNDNKYYSSYTISRVDSTDSRLDENILNLEKGEKVVHYYTHNYYLYALCVNSSNKGISLIKFKSENETSSHSYKVDEDLYDFINKGGFSIIKSSKSYTIPLLYKRKKMYLTESDKIIFTKDHSGGETDIYSLDLNSGKQSYNKIPFNIDLSKDISNNESPSSTESEASGVTNSFYFNEKLYRILLSRSMIGLYIYNFSSGSLEKNYQYNSEQNVDIVANEVVRQRGDIGLGLYNNDREVKEESVFGKLSLGKPAIGVKLFNKDTLSLLIGSYEYIYIPRYSYRIYLTWFNSFLKDSTYEIIKGLKEDYDFYKVDKYAEVLTKEKVRFGFNFIFNIKDKSYFAFFESKQKIIKIVEL